MANRGQIVRALDPKDPYARIHRDTIQDSQLSFRARGLLAFLLSRPEDWVVYKDELHKNCTEGRDAVRTAFKELQDSGYILSVRHMGDDGKFDGYSHIVYGTKQEIQPYAENPRAENPTSGNPTLQIKDNTNNKSTNPPIVPQEQVELLYELYPSKCPIKNRSLGNSSKDKETLKKRIIEFGFDYVKNSISYYLDDARKSESFLKNFSTLLNNLPEPPRSYTAERKVVKVNRTWDDNNGNHCADYIDDEGKIYSMRQVEFDYPNRQHYVKPEYQ